MDKNNFQNSMDKIEMNDDEKKNILNGALDNAKRRKKNKITTVLMAAACVVVITAMAIADPAGLFKTNTPQPSTLSTKEKTSQKNTGDNLASAEGGQINELAELHTFLWEGKNYTAINAAEISELNLNETIEPADIGQKLGTAFVYQGKNEFYEYKPAGCFAVVAVKQGDEYRLFRFSGFESYSKNEDENAKDYLELYGIKSAADIASLSVSENGTEWRSVASVSKIETFYNYFSPLTEAGQKYFDKLAESANEAAVPPDYQTVTDENGGQSSPGYDPWAGRTNPLEKTISIRIYNSSGLFLEFPYYPDFGFISRYEVNESFAGFLEQL